MPDPQTPHWCADLATQRRDRLAGTALHVRRLLLIEHDGPWPYHALEADGLGEDVVAQLVETTRQAVARTLLIRRPTREGRQAIERRWGVVDVGTGLARWGRWRDASDLPSVRAVLCEPSRDRDGRPAPGWSDDNAVLVCTHGRHDACCAARGRPVAVALAEAFGERVWECSHVGGDRFAGNVVVVPDGTFYGGLADPAHAVHVLAQHRDGIATAENLRGNAGLPPAAQAAAVEALRRWGPAGPRDILSSRVDPRADATTPTWDVHLTAREPLPAGITATVHREVAGPAAFLTCEAPRPVVPQRYVVTDLRRLS